MRISYLIVNFWNAIVILIILFTCTEAYHKQKLRSEGVLFLLMLVNITIFLLYLNMPKKWFLKHKNGYFVLC